MFPATLDLLESYAFDMCNVIEPSVRYEPALPINIQRHLVSIEDNLVLDGEEVALDVEYFGSVAWAPGSGLCPLLIMACGDSTPATSRVDSVQARDSTGEQHVTVQQHVLGMGAPLQPLRVMACSGGTPAISRVEGVQWR